MKRAYISLSKTQTKPSSIFNLSDFRLSKSLVFSGYLFSSDSKYVDCDTCDIAWLYKDAQMFGLPFYKSLGLDTVYCSGSSTSVLEPNPTMTQFFEECPSNFSKLTAQL